MPHCPLPSYIGVIAHAQVLQCAKMADAVDMIDISELLDDDPPVAVGAVSASSPAVAAAASSSTKKGTPSHNGSSSASKAATFSFTKKDGGGGAGSASKPTPSAEVKTMHRETLKLLSDVSPSKGMLFDYKRWTTTLPTYLAMLR